ncbi:MULTISPECIES: CMP-N-acetylneuraminic acid synthetase [Metasolibacillus]|uniref:CMP-N-acetylneuraminic acid synthetase n=1 Tax=Metasolibacillus TaxID=2703677 RepID=UPI000D3AF72C|nr:CMP-N-acetylneuraminic acid synthetase [Metasolibacillus fluoroglycofenilyticus]
MQNEQQKNIAFILEYSEWKGYYPFERVAIMHDLLAAEHISIFLKGNESHLLELLNSSPTIFKNYNELANKLAQQHFDLIIYDGNDSTVEQVQLLKAHCHTLVHFDDRGEGAELADCHIVALREETQEMIPANMLVGNFAFATPSELLQISFEDKLKNDLPHIVIAFEDGDENNLTYRTLRHLTQLHIPLKISVAIDENYRHSVEDLQMMVLSRRHTSIHQHPNALLSLLPTADIVVCNANYTPYKVATIGIPCITAAQNERELSNNLNREHNGFVHLGLGRKMKQSTIQNAVMEFVLHEARCERAIYKQRTLDLRTSNEALKQLLLDLAYARHEIIHI